MIYLLLGTNLGDRSANLSIARTMLEESLEVSLHCSPQMATEAIGFSGPQFLNQIVCFEAEIEPYKLLSICKQIESKMGRKQPKALFDKNGSRMYHNRIIDIDILMLNDVTMTEADLMIPHPQVESRSFVKELLQQL